MALGSGNRTGFGKRTWHLLVRIQDHGIVAAVHYVFGQPETILNV